MSAKVVTGRIDIGPLWSNMVDAINGRIRIDPSSYNRLTYGYAGGSSDNWDETAAAIDLVNLRLGNPSCAQLPAIEAFLRKKLSDTRFMQKEFGAWVYIDLHFQPTVVQYVEMRWRGNTGLANGLRGWLRAMGGYLAWTGCWAAGKTWAKSVSTDGPGARLLTGFGAYNPRTGGAPYCVFTGKRSLHFSGTWVENLFAPVIFSDLCLGVRLKQGDIWRAQNRFMECIESVYGPLGIFTPEEQQKLLAASRNDINALEWCRAELIGNWLPAEENTFIRTEHGVGQVLHEAAQAATAPIYYSGWIDDGTTYAAFADNGGRGGHGEQIEDGRAEIDLLTRRGWCQRTTGPDRVRVDFTLPRGDLVAVWSAKHGGHSTVNYYKNGQRVLVGSSSRPPTTAQPPEVVGQPGRETFIQKLWRWIRGG